MSSHTLDRTNSGAEAREIVRRFESLYASLPMTEEEKVPPTPSASTALFSDDAFELPDTRPAESLQGSSARASEGIRPKATSQSGSTAAPSEPTAAVDSLDDALAILRGSEKSVATRERAADAEADAEAEARSERKLRRSQSNPKPREVRRSVRQFAVPAIAVTVFVGVSTGYLLTRNTDLTAALLPASKPATSAAAAASPSAAPASLRLDYDLERKTRSAGIATQPAH